MEVLIAAYGSDDEDERDNAGGCNRKRRADDEHPGAPPKQVAGRYVSKRERAAAAAAAKISLPSEESAGMSSSSSRSSSSLLSSNVPREILKKVNNSNGCSELPQGMHLSLRAHTKAVTAVRWSSSHAGLLASAGMDGKTCVWNIWDGSLNPSRTFVHHASAVKDVQWSPDGSSVLTCGFNKSCSLVDVERGDEIRKFEDDNVVNSVKFHPLQEEVFLSGNARGVNKLWDVRTGASIRKYFKDVGQVLDFDFSRDGRHFVCSYDIAHRNSSDRSVIVWDFASQIAVSNQVYLEAYTCPCVRYHPFEQSFVAQTNGGYIAIFSARQPFRMNKYKRYEGHQVAGFPVRCNFSPDGELLVSGSSTGWLHFYSYRSSRLLRRMHSGHGSAVTDAAFHPRLPSLVASGSWDGTVCTLQ